MATTTQTHRAGRSSCARHRHMSSIVLAGGRVRVAAEVAALVLIALLLVALPIMSRDAKTAVLTSTAKLIVQPGDTLWSVAQSNPLPGMTTAETADHIATINGYDASRLAVGSSILVPVSSGSMELACK